MNNQDEKLERLHQRIFDDYFSLKRICPEHGLLELAQGLNQGIAAFTREFMIRYNVPENRWKEIDRDFFTLYGYLHDLEYALENLRR